MKKYRFRNYAALEFSVVEVERETKDFVFVDGCRRKKQLEYEGYFDTIEDMRLFLEKQFANSIECLEREISWGENKIRKLKTLFKEVNNLDESKFKKQ